MEVKRKMEMKKAMEQYSEWALFFGSEDSNNTQRLQAEFRREKTNKQKKSSQAINRMLIFNCEDN